MTALACVGKGGFRTLDAEEADHLPVELGCEWSPYDPLVWVLWVKVGATEPVRWEFARDLLIDAAATSAIHGYMDIKVLRLPNPKGDTLSFFLYASQPGDVDCLVHTTAAPIMDLLGQSLALVPAGSELVDVDAAVTRILAAEDAA